MATRAELISEVLEDLGILAIGETASAEDTAKTTDKYKFVHEMLQQDDLLPFDNDDAIPSEYVQPMIMLTAAAISPAYRIQADFPGTFNLVKSMIRNINQDYTASSTTQFSDF